MDKESRLLSNIDRTQEMMNCVAGLDEQIVAAGVKDPIAREQIAYLVYLMSLPADADERVFDERPWNDLE